MPRTADAVTSDSEGAADVTVSEPLTQFQIEGGVMLQLDAVAARALTLFVTVGAGYLRQLHEEQTLVETGGRPTSAAGCCCR